MGLGGETIVALLEKLGCLSSHASEVAQSRIVVDQTQYAALERAMASGVERRRSGTGSKTIGLLGAVRNRLRRFGVGAAEIVRMICDGELRYCGLDKDARGLERLLLRQEDIDAIASAAKARILGNRFDAPAAAEYLCLPRVGTVYDIRNMGKIVGRQFGGKQGGLIAFEIEELDRFRARYITLSEMVGWGPADGTRWTANTVRALLRDHGIEPRFEAVASDNRKTPFYDRDACTSALQSRSSPRRAEKSANRHRMRTGSPGRKIPSVNISGASPDPQ